MRAARRFRAAAEEVRAARLELVVRLEEASEQGGGLRLRFRVAPEGRALDLGGDAAAVDVLLPAREMGACPAGEEREWVEASLVESLARAIFEGDE